VVSFRVGKREGAILIEHTLIHDLIHNVASEFIAREIEQRGDIVFDFFGLNDEVTFEVVVEQ